MPRRVRALCQASEVNCAPRSEVTVTGMPKREIQLSMNVWTTVSAVTFAMGTASGQRVVLLIIVRRYLKPRSGGNSPRCRRELGWNALAGLESGGQAGWWAWRSCSQHRRDTVVPSKVSCCAYPAKRMIWRWSPGWTFWKGGPSSEPRQNMAAPNLGDENLGSAKWSVAHNCAVDAGENGCVGAWARRMAPRGWDAGPELARRGRH